MLLNTATEGLEHIEMLATAVGLKLERAPSSLQEEAAPDRVVNAALSGMDLKHFLSACLAAMPVGWDGIHFDMFHVYASGNIAADMTTNITAESTGRVLAVPLQPD